MTLTLATLALNRFKLRKSWLPTLGMPLRLATSRPTARLAFVFMLSTAAIILFLRTEWLTDPSALRFPLKAPDYDDDEDPVDAFGQLSGSADVVDPLTTPALDATTLASTPSVDALAEPVRDAALPDASAIAADEPWSLAPLPPSSPPPPFVTSGPCSTFDMHFVDVDVVANIAQRPWILDGNVYPALSTTAPTSSASPAAQTNTPSASTAIATAQDATASSTTTIASTTATGTATTASATVPPRILFLHYNEQLESPRYLCAVESAARWNPGHDVVIFAKNAAAFLATAKPMLRAAALDAMLVGDGMLGLARLFDVTDAAAAAAGAADRVEEEPLPGRVLVTELRWADAMAGTPLQAWHAAGKQKQTKWEQQNLGNAFRLGAVHTLGGVYMDLDIVSLNPLRAADRLGRAVALQDQWTYNNDMLSFPRGDPMLWRLMEEFVEGFNGYVWGNNGPKMVTRTFLKLCQPPAPSPSPTSAETKNSTGGAVTNGTAAATPPLSPPPPAPECHNLNVAAPHVFHPVKYQDRALLFRNWSDSCTFLDTLVTRSIGLHWWHKLVQDTMDLSSDSVLARVLERACPATLATFGHDALGITVKAATPPSSSPSPSSRAAVASPTPSGAPLAQGGGATGPDGTPVVIWA
ncbi:Lactosylceramide 4-alpha-galactosyltransferase [Cladochytrium tenue]|nr:Lactosylceramide 4-alpha-galactosyltransferase [Cladochytrium tenue]